MFYCKLYCKYQAKQRPDFPQFAKKGSANEEWRKQLLQKINREDKGFNPETAAICSKHFTEECFKCGEQTAYLSIFYDFRFGSRMILSPKSTMTHIAQSEQHVQWKSVEQREKLREREREKVTHTHTRAYARAHTLTP